jgi:hypothetical protein
VSGWQQVESTYGEFGFNHEHDYFGAQISLSKDGTTLAIGAPLAIDNFVQAGHVRTFRRNQQDRSWELDSTIPGEATLDHFGSSVALSLSGNTMVIGGADCFDPDRYYYDHNKGYMEVYCYDTDGESWSLLGDMCLGESAFHDDFGRDVSVSNSGNVIAVGGRGIACVFEWKEDAWVRVGSPIGVNSAAAVNNFGASVELAGESMTLAIFEPSNFVVFEYVDGSWRRNGSLIQAGTFNMTATMGEGIIAALSLEDGIENGLILCSLQ